MRCSASSISIIEYPSRLQRRKAA